MSFPPGTLPPDAAAGGAVPLPGAASTLPGGPPPPPGAPPGGPLGGPPGGPTPGAPLPGPMDLAAQLAQEEAGPNAPRPASSLGDGTIPHPAQLLPDLAEIDYNVDLDEDERVKLAHRLVREFQHYREFTAARREFALEYRKAARMMPD